MSFSKHQADAGTVAPSGNGRLIDLQPVHDGENVRGHEFVGIGPLVSRAAAMAPAVDDDNLMAGIDQGRNLIAPIAAVSEPAMQENYGSAAAIGGIPDTRAIMIDMAFRLGMRQGCGPFGFEAVKLIVVKFHTHLPLRRLLPTALARD